MEASELTPEQLAEQHKKDELAAQAQAAGVEVKSSDTKTDIAEKLVEAAGVGNVVEDGVRDTEPNAPAVGQWVDVLDGEYAGRKGAYLQDVQTDPRTVLVQTRDADNLQIQVPYDSIRLSAYTGGR